MTIVKRKAKKAKNGYTWEVDKKFTRWNGTKGRHIHKGFISKAKAQKYQDEICEELAATGDILSYEDKYIMKAKKAFEALKNEQKNSNCDYLKDKTQYEYSINDIFEEYLPLCSASKELGPQTIYDMKCKYKRYIKDDLGNNTLKQINYKKILSYFNTMGETCGLATLESIKKILNRIYCYAIKMEYTDRNLTEGIKLNAQATKHQRTGEKTCPKEHVKMIIDYYLKKGDMRNMSYAIGIMIANDVGPRISEVCALDKSDVNFQKKTITFSKSLISAGLKTCEIYASSNMKSEASHDILPISDELCSSLIQWFKINPYEHILCDDHGNYLNPRTYSSRNAKVSKELGIHFYFHKGRYNLATNLIGMNVSITTAQKLLRHANFTTTANSYVQTDDTVKREALEKLKSKQIHVDLDQIKKEDISSMN